MGDRVDHEVNGLLNHLLPDASTSPFGSDPKPDDEPYVDFRTEKSEGPCGVRQ